MSIHKVVNGEMKEIASNARWDAATKTLSIDGTECFSTSSLAIDVNCFLELDAHQVSISTDTNILEIDHDGRLFGSASLQTSNENPFAILWFRKNGNDVWKPLLNASQTINIDLTVKSGFQFLFAGHPDESNDINNAVVLPIKHNLALYY